MDELEKYLTQSIEELEEYEKQSRIFLKKAPKGKLYVYTNKGTYQYRVKLDEGTCNEKIHYISKKNMKLIRDLAQKDYDALVLEAIKKEKKTYKKFLEICKKKRVESVYYKLPKQKKAVVTPFILQDKEYVENWIAQQKHITEAMIIKYENEYNNEYNDQYPLSDDNGFRTERGEIVRSKSEKILADKFYMRGIPYVYEQPLMLDNSVIVKPDFKLLNIRTRKEYLWEHFGLMDDEKYATKTVRKIINYENNNIFTGENIILTYETKRQPLNMKSVDKLIERYLK